MVYTVDTHALLWFITADQKLSAQAKKALSDPSAILLIPSIVLAEASFLVRKKKVPVSEDELREAVLSDPDRLKISLLDATLALGLPRGLEMHDAIIVGAALAYERDHHEPAVVITKDRHIRESGLVRTLW